MPWWKPRTQNYSDTNVEPGALARVFGWEVNCSKREKTNEHVLIILKTKRQHQHPDEGTRLHENPE
jgi:hypothetical protein